MDLVLISSDGALYDLCKHVLSACSKASRIVVADRDSQIDADVCIWEYIADLPEPSAVVESGCKRVMIVHPQELPNIPFTIKEKNSNILLKPVSPAALRAVIASLDSDSGTAIHSSVAALRSDRDELLQSLLQTNLRLQEYDQERTNFLARAVHDFRAPLTALNGYCGLLLSEEPGPLSIEQQEVLKRMLDSAKRLTRMTSAMFELSVEQRLETRTDLQMGDMRTTIYQALNEVMPLFTEKRIAVSVEIVDPAEPVMYDNSRIGQVILNLLDNASKFTPRGGSVSIRGYPCFWERRNRFAGPFAQQRERRATAIQHANSYRVDFSDSGEGVPGDMIEKIFEEYTTCGGSGDRSGGGLGLAICRMVLQRHLGRIWAENSPAGPQFSFLLPNLQTDRRHAIGAVPDRRLTIVAGRVHGA